MSQFALWAQPMSERENAMRAALSAAEEMFHGRQYDREMSIPVIALAQLLLLIEIRNDIAKLANPLMSAGPEVLPGQWPYVIR